jgi:AraC-like DNA-binding protein
MQENSFAAIGELAKEIARFAPIDGFHTTPVSRLSLFRASQATEPVHGVQHPALCIVAQGRKQVLLGEDMLTYGTGQCLVISVGVPMAGQVVEATLDEPYLCFRLELDPAMLASLIFEMRLPPMDRSREALAIAVSEATPGLADAALRLVRLLGAPGDIAMLAPLIEREILYRLLTGPQAGRLREIATGESRAQQVSRAIGWLQANFAEPFRAEVLATESRMSLSSLHFHFKEVTGLSPLQYQKQLRLQEARRLILAEALDAASAGHRVGYDSPSQFSREYSRLFGAPPRRDIDRLRAAPERFVEV